MEILKEIFNGNLSGVGLLTSNEYKKASNKLIEMFPFPISVVECCQHLVIYDFHKK